VISDLNQNLPSLLQSVHISNAVPSAHVSAAVNLILTTVNRFASLMPHSPTAISASARTRSLTSTERSEAAVEPAGVCVNGQRKPGLGIRAKRAAVIEQRGSSTFKMPPRPEGIHAVRSA
jgi:hypothetical protein